MSEVCKTIETLVSEKERLIDIYKELISLKTMLVNCYKVIESDLSLCEDYIEYVFQGLEDKGKLIRLNLESMPLPKHRAVVLRSSDKGPGVGSNEKLVQIRMAETFQIYYLDLRALVHLCSQ